MLSDVERILNYLAGLDAGFANWARGSNRVPFANEQLAGFSIDQMQAAADRILKASGMPQRKRDILKMIRAEILLNRSDARPDFCEVCKNERLIAVVTPGTIQTIASGKLDFMRSTSLPCECNMRYRTLQQARRELRCIIQFEHMLTEATNRESEYSRRSNGHPLPVGYTAHDIVCCRIVYDWISAHRLAKMIDRVNTLGEAHNVRVAFSSNADPEIILGALEACYGMIPELCEVKLDPFHFYPESRHTIATRIDYLFEQRRRFTEQAQAQQEPPAEPATLEGGDSETQAELFGDSSTQGGAEKEGAQE